MNQRSIISRIARADRMVGAVFALIIIIGAVFVSLRGAGPEAPRFEVDQIGRAHV